eukprot:jgi/Tetstr1/450252/TSEL_037290.t1
MKCYRSPGETVRDFRNRLRTHTAVKDLVTEETTRVVETSRVNVEFIQRAWGKTRFSSRIEDAEHEQVDYTLDMSAVAAEMVAAGAATTVGAEMEEVIVGAGARRGALTPVTEITADDDLRPETAMAATNLREHIRVREEPKKPDCKLSMVCGKDADHTTEECGKLRKFVANMQATDGNEAKTPQWNGYAQVGGGEEGKGGAGSPATRSTEAQRHAVNTPRMLLMDIAKRMVKHEPVEDGLMQHVVMLALESKRVTISLMEAYWLERSGGGMMEIVMATT